ncbi:uncharacterized protein EDB93DRAFT_1255332 [Suillus bovinus]|uniref:uncharacterized protein n=1 Tax=Suillus bovinus TaxID=48563 RepID=UPI001B85DA68|nr:uncharacterized protein EDB93DRAFT_1255332 [Suillus bovinus]KAG2132146.1 hypothetical protein EDB93DRAFT_1255332 [Suillus bovinus]
MAVANNVSDGQLFAKHAELESKKALHFSFHIRRLRIQAIHNRTLTPSRFPSRVLHDMTPIVLNKLNFVSRDLGMDLELLLTFDHPSNTGIYETYYPLAFAVKKFAAEGIHRAHITYRSQLAFTKVVVSHDIIQSASTEVAVQVGQSTTLTMNNQIFHFSDPQTDPSVPKKNIQCINNSPSKEDIGVGFIEQEGDVPTSALVWHGVEHGQTLNVEFVPRLRGYINACTYRQNGLIKGPIHSSCLFDQDLSTLDKHTTWVVTYDETARSFRIDEEITSEVQHCFS